MPRKKKPTRRGNGEGSIFQRKDGRWSGQVTVGYKEDGKPDRKIFYGKTREEVAKKVTDAASKVFNGTIENEVLSTSKASVTTVEKLVTDFLWTFKRPAVADVTYEWYLNISKIHIVPVIGSLAASELTPHTLQTAFNNMHGKYSGRTIKAMRDLLNQTYNHAVELKLSDVNPVSGTKLPKESRVKANKRETVKALTVADRVRVLSAAEQNASIRTALTVLMLTGMRVGEWLAMTWGQIDFNNHIITIDRAITLACDYDADGVLLKRETVVGDTKTKCSVRSFKVDPVVTKVLQEWREVLPGHVRRSVKHDILGDDCVVFPNDMGVMRTYDGFRATYRRFMDKNNLGGYTLHSFRHTFATMLLVERGVNIKVVSKLLGHSYIETTLRVYSHVLSEVYEGVAGVVGELYADMTGGGIKVPETVEV